MSSQPCRKPHLVPLVFGVSEARPPQGGSPSFVASLPRLCMVRWLWRHQCGDPQLRIVNRIGPHGIRRSCRWQSPLERMGPRTKLGRAGSGVREPPIRCKCSIRNNKKLRGSRRYSHPYKQQGEKQFSHNWFASLHRVGPSAPARSFWHCAETAGQVRTARSVTPLSRSAQPFSFPDAGPMGRNSSLLERTTKRCRLPHRTSLPQTYFLKRFLGSAHGGFFALRRVRVFPISGSSGIMSRPMALIMRSASATQRMTLSTDSILF